MIGRSLELLNGDAAIFGDVASSHRRCLLRQSALHQIFSMLAKFGDLVSGYEAAHDKEAVCAGSGCIGR